MNLEMFQNELLTQTPSVPSRAELLVTKLSNSVYKGYDYYSFPTTNVAFNFLQPISL